MIHLAELWKLSNEEQVDAVINLGRVLGKLRQIEK